MAILAFMLLNNISSLSNKCDYLVHHDTPVLVNARYTQPLYGRQVLEDTSAD